MQKENSLHTCFFSSDQQEVSVENSAVSFTDEQLPRRRNTGVTEHPVLSINRPSEDNQIITTTHRVGFAQFQSHCQRARKVHDGFAQKIPRTITKQLSFDYQRWRATTLYPEEDEDDRGQGNLRAQAQEVAMGAENRPLTDSADLELYRELCCTCIFSNESMNE